MATAPSELSADLTVYRNFVEILSTEDMIIPRCALHVAIDPVTGRREATLYTDDGEGNGDGIFKIALT